MQEDPQEQAELRLNRGALGKAAVLCAVIVAGLGYNLYDGGDVFARHFAPLGLPLSFGYVLIAVIALSSLWVGARLCVLCRAPVTVARADDAGLHLAHLGLVPWAKVSTAWLGSALCAKPARFGACLYVQANMACAAKAAMQLHGVGYLADKAILRGNGVRMRFWLPFVPFAQKEAFCKVLERRLPHSGSETSGRAAVAQ